MKKKEIKEGIEDWFERRTANSSDFSDLGKQSKLKEEQDISISVAIPTLDEEKTIEKIITTIEKDLMGEECKLVDELAIIDSGSKDSTRKIAKELGADVYLANRYLTKYNLKGKGVNLWKSLYLLKGDIIVWVDADISNFDSKFVYGLIGPLLKDKDIKYVKAFYRRPIKMGKKLHPTGGGRVTEIEVKPLINAFFPHLAGILQPLSGEYAIKRDVAEKIRFSSGYGVETGLLLDVDKLYGVGGIAQVDMQTRVHRNRELRALKPMSFGILQTFLRKAEERGKIKVLEEINRYLVSSRFYKDKHKLEINLIEDIDLPLITEIKEYRKKFKKSWIKLRLSRIKNYMHKIKNYIYKEYF